MLGWNEAVWFAFLWSLALKGTAVLCAAYLAAFALRHRSAAARHLVWTAAFAALLALPLLSVSLPSLRIPGASSILPDASNLVFRATATATAADALQQTQSPMQTPRIARPLSSSQSNWPLWLMLCWIGGSLVVLGQMVVAYIGMARQRASAPSFLDSHAMGEMPRGVLALQAARGSMPMTFGVLQPVVFMPADA